jgi:hypothetical protein
MRIISKKRDYYDIGQSQGVDQSLVYVRTEQEIDIPPGYCQTFEKGVIGFCGKIYPFMLLRKLGEITHIFYDEKAIRSFIESQPKEFGDNPKYRWNDRYGIHKFFDLKCSYLLPNFLKYKAPIFVKNNTQGKLYINPLLRPYQFYRVFPPYEAYQEISMYVSNILLNPVPPIPKISDEDMISAKGFDRFSFRKDPKS